MAESDWVDVEEDWVDVPEATKPTEVQKLEPKIAGLPSQFTSFLRENPLQATSPAGLAMEFGPKLRDIQQSINFPKAYREMGLLGSKSTDVNVQTGIELLGGATRIATDPLTYGGVEIAKELPMELVKSKYTRPIIEKYLPNFFGKSLKATPEFATAPKLKYDIKATNLAENVRGSIYQAKHDAVEKFGMDIDNLAKQSPDSAVSLRPIIDEIKTDLIDMSPQARTAFEKTPLLGKMLDRPEIANNVSLRDTQEMINYLNTKIPSTIKYNHLEILNTIDDLRAAQLEAFPEMAEVRASYANVKNAFNLLKNKIKQGNVLKNIAEDWGDPEIKKAASKLLDGKEILNDMKNYQSSIRSLKMLGVITDAAVKGAATTAGVGAMYELYKTIKH